MDRKDQGRKEPTLADLEAFEKLLRESLQVEPPAPAAAGVPLAQVPPAAAARPEPAAASAMTPDQLAMAELARLIDQPVDIGQPSLALQTPAPPALDHMDANVTTGWQQEPAVPVYPTKPEARPTPASRPSHDKVAPSAAMNDRPAREPTVSVDPLAAFEQELRRFDAIRMSERQAPQSYPAAEPYPAPPAAPYAAPAYAEAGADRWPPEATPTTPASAAELSLQAAEDRLAAQAAAAAAAADGNGGSGRSRGIFLALGGLAVAGGAVLAGSMLFGSGGSGPKTANGSVPVIAARPEPAKERPANPGGMEIPNQNKQVLSPRNANESQPAQVVNNTEQPLDLNQVTRRDGVRVVAPSPYQQGGQPPAGEGANPALEPRRVTSVRIPVGGDGPAVAAASTTTSPPAAVAAPTVTAPTPPVAPPRAAVTAPPAMTVPTPAAPSAGPGNPSAPKVESRPNVTPSRPNPDAPRPTTAPTPTTGTSASAPATNPVPRVAANTPAAPTAAPSRPANAPMVLSPTPAPAAAAATPPRPAQNAAPARPAPATPASDEDDDAQPAAGAFAVQLASRPTEEDARKASAQLKTRYSAALGGKVPGVVSGTANGQTVYRVRVGGYSQNAANEACNKVKAAGGNCFVTRQ